MLHHKSFLKRDVLYTRHQNVWQGSKIVITFSMIENLTHPWRLGYQWTLIIFYEILSKKFKMIGGFEILSFFDCAISTISAKKFVKQTGCLQPSNLSWYRLKLYCNILSSTVLKMNGLDFSQHSWALVNGFEIENYVGISPEKKKSFKKSFSFLKSRYGKKHKEF